MRKAGEKSTVCGHGFVSTALRPWAGDGRVCRQRQQRLLPRWQQQQQLWRHWPLAARRCRASPARRACSHRRGPTRMARPSCTRRAASCTGCSRRAACEPIAASLTRRLRSTRRAGGHPRRASPGAAARGTTAPSSTPPRTDRRALSSGPRGRRSAAGRTTSRHTAHLPKTVREPRHAGHLQFRRPSYRSLEGTRQLAPP